MVNLLSSPHIPPVRVSDPQVSQALQNLATFLNKNIQQTAAVVNDYLSGSGPASGIPSAGVFAGQTYYETDTSKTKQWDGSAWVDFGGGGGGTSLEISQGTLSLTGTTIDLVIGEYLTLDVVGTTHTVGTLTGPSPSSGGTVVAGSGISIIGTNTINNTGLLGLREGTVNSTGIVTVGTGLTLSGNTLSGSSALPIYQRTPYSAFTLSHNTTATITDNSNGPLVITSPTSNGDDTQYLAFPITSSTFSYIAQVDFNIWNQNYVGGGVLLLDSSGKFVTCNFMWNGGQAIQTGKYNGPSSFNSQYQLYGYPLISPRFVKFNCDGTTLTIYISSSGWNGSWLLILSEPLNDFLSGAAGLGFFLNPGNNGSATPPISVALLNDSLVYASDQSYTPPYP